MPRHNYIHKDAYKRQKRKLEDRTKGLVDRLNAEMGLKKKSKAIHTAKTSQIIKSLPKGLDVFSIES